MRDELINQLTRVIGRAYAQQELRWMKQALSSSRRPSLPSLPALTEMVQRRVDGEPLQYILGTQPFGHLELRVRPPVLIPRPETEEWTIRLAELLRSRLGANPQQSLRTLDLCTGTGCIPLLLRHELSSVTNVIARGVDLSQDAVALAQENAEDCSNAGQTPLLFDRADILSPNFGESLRKHVEATSNFHVITSNPPYIPLAEYVQLDSVVKDWEDPRALLGDPNDWPNSLQASSSTPETPEPNDGRGLTFYRAIAHLAARPGILFPGWPVVLEVGKGQADDVAAILTDTKVPQSSTRDDSTAHPAFERTEKWVDAWGVERVVLGWRA